MGAVVDPVRAASNGDWMDSSRHHQGHGGASQPRAQPGRDGLLAERRASLMYGAVLNTAVHLRVQDMSLVPEFSGYFRFVSGVFFREIAANSQFGKR